jgi:endothelin-converting enzyme/putative endopeptidase
MRLFLCAAITLVSTAFAQTPATPAANRSNFNVENIDRSVSPCEDFYRYACGTWLKNNPIPADRPEWGRFDELAERNQAILREILDSASRRGASGSPVDQKIGAFYRACMDEKVVEEKGDSPLKPELDRIRAIHDLPSLTLEIGRLQRMGVDAVFSTGSGQDFKDSTKVIAQLDQAGIGLPERDYYFKTDKTSEDLRQKYVKHVAKMFQLLGQDAETAQASAQVVMKMETQLADASQNVTFRRDPANEYHPMGRPQVNALAPAFDWKVFLPEAHADVQQFNVVAPDFFKGMEAMLGRLSYDDWKTYLTWHLVHSEASWLSKPFVDENFDFFALTLSGQKEQRPRWKRCVALTDGSLGEALGQAYVDRTFGVEGKERTLKMVRDIEDAMEADIKTVEWMTPETKQRAIEKLHAVANKIGYPDKWRDYSKVQVLPTDLVGNEERASEFEFDRQMAKIGQPVDKAEWQMTPATVNAYYDPQMNNINFPAGILQPPFYQVGLDDAVNYGASGAVIGHELTHGFDDQGRQFDGAGNFTDWWSKEDGAAYDAHSKCIEDEYGNFVADGEVKENGKLTEGENIADNGGLHLAYMALQKLLVGKKISEVDGFTPQQRFFLGFAGVWCTNLTPQVKRLEATTDPHSLPEYRVNGTLFNMPEFAAAFSCKAGQPMVPKTRCRVW